MYSNEYFIEQLHRQAEARATTAEQRETIELSREATDRVLKNPAFRLLMSLEVVFVSVRSLLILLLIVWIALSILAERLSLFLPFWLLASTSTSILSLGTVINTIVKIALLQGNTPFSPMFFFGSYDGADPIHFVLARSDIFSLYFLSLVSFRASAIYQEKPLVILSLSLACWTAVLLLAFLFKFSFSLTL